MIMCFVDGENIVQQDYIGNRQIVGKTAAAYAELEQTAEEYYNKLVELGVIVPPKTPEDTMAEMQKNMDQLTNIIAALAAEGETEILDADCVKISYPNFYADLLKL
jgi:hypothetical protein